MIAVASSLAFPAERSGQSEPLQAQAELLHSVPVMALHLTQSKSQNHLQWPVTELSQIPAIRHMWAF